MEAVVAFEIDLPEGTKKFVAGDHVDGNLVKEFDLRAKGLVRDYPKPKAKKE